MAEYIVNTDVEEARYKAMGADYSVCFNNKLVAFLGNPVEERIVRCKDCKKRLPKGWRFDKYCNEAEQDACNLFSAHDFDWNYTSFFYVEPDDFCKWGEEK